jgi:ribokinase
VKVACVGHVEWLHFAHVDHVPAPGEIIHATGTWEEPAGGGAMAAIQLARLGGGATFFTALGDDAHGHAAVQRLEEAGLRVHVAWRDEPQRQAFTFLDAQRERTITVMGDRLVPFADDDLPWDELADVDAVYITGGDAGALRKARAARVVTATPRVGPALHESHVELDALILSANDATEVQAARDLDPPPRLVVSTEGEEGGEWTGAEGRTGHFEAAPLPAKPADSYGAGDCFAACVTFALGEGKPVDEALSFGAACGAEAMTRPGGWGGEAQT